MEEHPYEGLTLDWCPACRGLYFDAGELSDAAGVVLPEMITLRSSDRRCAGCGSPFLVARMGTVEIDRCGRCGGCYLDCGELPQLREGRPPVPKKRRKEAPDRPPPADERIEPPLLRVLADIVIGFIP